MPAPGVSTLTMENIRCFSKERVELGPMTVLLGENSSGKSTALGCLQTVLESFKHPRTRLCLPFNEQPHSMGGFRHMVKDLAMNKKTKQHGIKLTYEEGLLKCEFYFEEHSKGTWVELRRLEMTLHDTHQSVVGSVVFNLCRSINTTLNYFPRKKQVVVKMDDDLFASNQLEKILRGHLGYYTMITHSDRKNARAMMDETSSIGALIADQMPHFESVGSPATWSPALRSFDITENGNHGDFTLAVRLWWLKQEAKGTWSKLRRELNGFGKEFDLFSNIDIVPYNGSSDRVAVMVSRDGKQINICDLGFGIWQVLHQLVRIKLASIEKKKSYFMIQQADVHAHPRVHAEMTSLYCKGLGDGHRFILETDSDYVTDRMSIEICRKTIDFENVAIGYFLHDKRGKRCKIHNLKLDLKGDVIDMPRFYKRFMLDEGREFVLTAPTI